MPSPKCFCATGFVVHDGRTLLLKHKKLGMWLPPGGHIDEGELPEEALLREVREETGLEVEILSERRGPDPEDGRVRFLRLPNHMQLEEIPGHNQHIDLIFFCRALHDRVAPGDGEAKEFRWHSEEDLRGGHVSEEVRATGLAAIRHAAAWRGTADRAAAGG